MRKKILPLRNRLRKKLISQTDTPIIVYIAVVIAILIALSLRRFHEELSLNLVSELLGAAFIIFVVNLLLVRSKNKRWKVVNSRIDYLIGRNVNQIRDSIATFAFNFNPELSEKDPHPIILEAIRKQRDDLFEEMKQLSEDEIVGQLSDKLFTDDQLKYFSQRADDLWSILNMKYSEYLAPELVSLLMDLHIQINDLCAHIRSFNKSRWFIEDSFFYQETGKKGAAYNVREILKLVTRLKEEGYSEVPRLIGK
ncbi:MAG: hypothetical protein EA409_03010 [Saprospirales bacterium]|nr:MAG: hypothetical protein EA409_03010 [Saprospirales bacterium]